MMKKIFLIVFISTVTLFLHAQSSLKTRNIILITIDGLRWQEVFSGADSSLLNNKEHVKDIKTMQKKYWNSNPLTRRNLLMPFIWESIAAKGQIYGNRNLDSKVNVTNNYWFSYPGYSEILCGFADDRVNTNELGPNPNLTVLDFLNQKPEFRNKIAVFASWDVFPDIVNEKRNGILVNSGFKNLECCNNSAKVELLNEIQVQLPDVFYGIRLDAVTYNMAFEYLKSEKPRFLFIALDETDDFGHHGSYDYYLNTARYTDDFIRQTWEWVQTDPSYKDKTTMIIAVDHGRGLGTPGWKSHGKKTAHSDETWFAVIGPDTPAQGEIKEGQYYNSQYANTMAYLLGLEYKNDRPVGAVIENVVGR